MFSYFYFRHKTKHEAELLAVIQAIIKLYIIYTRTWKHVYWILTLILCFCIGAKNLDNKLPQEIMGKTYDESQMTETKNVLRQEQIKLSTTLRIIKP